jgi:hypothetical protein
MFEHTDHRNGSREAALAATMPVVRLRGKQLSPSYPRAGKKLTRVEK